MIQIEEPNGDVPNSIVSNPSEGQMITQKPVRIGENCYQNAPKQLASPQQQLQRSFQGPDLGHHHRPPEQQQQHQVPASETALRAISSPSCPHLGTENCQSVAKIGVKPASIIML